MSIPSTFAIGKFRTSFPEFADSTAYPDDMITLWSTLAQQQVKQNVWCNSWLMGVSLYTAHEITLAAQNSKAAQVGGVPGVSGGVANTKTVGSVTVGYDAQTTSEKDAGYWNLTNYGKQFIRLARIFGARPIQL